MSGEPLIQVRDPTRIHCLVMPSPRAGGMYPSPPPPTAAGRASSAALAFPWMMQPPSQHAGGESTSLHVGSLHLAVGGGGCASSSSCAPPPQSSSMIASGEQGGSSAVLVPGWAASAGYTVCGLGLGLCNLLAPGYIQTCAHALCPVWTLALALHIVGHPHRQDSAWVWSGILTLLLLPFVILVGAPLFIGFYLLVFAVFSSGCFWRRLQGTAFILAWVCWGGLLLSFGLSTGVGLPPQMHLCVAAFFSISLGVIGSGGGKFVMSVG